MTTKNLGVTLALASAVFALAALPVKADSSCTDQYGATVNCPTSNIVINKTVRYPTNPYLFVENLTGNDPAYSPNDEVEYDVAVTNTSNVNFPTVTVIDVFPSQETFVSGPGTYDASSNKLTYELSDLNAGATAHNRILTRVKDASVFPADQAITCNIVNTATATGPGGQSDQDTSSLCVQTKVLGASQLPVAGFNDWMVALPFATAGLAGLGLTIKKGRRKVS
jgi:uncharacterized repeat protein (TIGR01451 family)